MFYDATSTTTRLRAAAIDIAVVSIGAIEQHARHLPLGTDWIAVQALARRVAAHLAQELDVLLVPAFPYSLSQCHGPMLGTVWLKPETLASVLSDTVTSLYDQGICHILVLNGHGGNFVLESEIRELNALAPDLVVLSGASLRATQAKGPSGRVVGGDIHAGAGETAGQLYQSPEDVRLGSVDYVPPVGREFLDYAYMSQISPDGVWGRPSQAVKPTNKDLEDAAAVLAAAAARAFAAVRLARRGSSP